MTKLNEIIDSLNDENASEVKEQLLAEANALDKNNKQLYTRAKKAEGFEQDKETKEWIKKEEKPPEKKLEANKSNSEEPDYGRLAFLKGENVTHPDDQKIVMDEASRLKLPLTDILQMVHIKSKLKDAKDQRDVETGSSKGKGRSGSNTRSEVDYWINKKKTDGSFDTPDDQELAEKVIDARIKNDKNSSKFSKELF